MGPGLNEFGLWTPNVIPNSSRTTECLGRDPDGRSLSRHSLVLSQFGPGHHMKLRSPFLCLESGPTHGWKNFTALEPPEVRSPVKAHLRLTAQPGLTDNRRPGPN